MSGSRSLILLFVFGLCVLPALAAGPGDNPGVRHAGARPGGPPIHNKVVDLLDEALFLDSDTPSWTSSPFVTGQFNRAILKTASEVENGFLRCYIQWQFSTDDAFQTFGPRATVIGDDINPRIVDPSGADAHLVYGLRARVRCDLNPGPDFGISDPPPPATGSLTDVKVLLRRE